MIQYILWVATSPFMMTFESKDIACATHARKPQSVLYEANDSSADGVFGISYLKKLARITCKKESVTTLEWVTEEKK